MRAQAESVRIRASCVSIDSTALPSGKWRIGARVPIYRLQGGVNNDVTSLSSAPEGRQGYLAGPQMFSEHCFRNGAAVRIVARFAPLRPYREPALKEQLC